MPPASASSGNNNSNNAAAQAAAKAEREEKLRGALKAFILKDRQRKKEEFEAKIEEERKRREREARERENDMTLEETRAQIAKLDEKLTELRDQKQQLFLQLKIVLNEDETRKKEQKDRELALAQQASAAPQQVFLPPVRTQHHQMPMLPKQVSNQPVKRGRSPSPPSTHQGYYKSTSYSQPKYDDGRARVLWNKPTTPYQNPGTLFYQTTSNAPQPPPTADTRGPALIYPQYNLPLRQGYHLELQQPVTVQTSKTDQSNSKPTQVYHINLDQPTIPQAGVGSGPTTVVQSQKPQVTMEKINDRYHEVKHESVPQGTHVPSAPHGLDSNVVFTALMPGIPMLPSVLQIGQNLVQSAKGGASITQGYAQARAVGASAHEQQMARQQQMSVMQGQQGQASQQPIHYQRRLM